jgi:hypothetical protein
MRIALPTMIVSVTNPAGVLASFLSEVMETAKDPWCAGTGLDVM